MSQPKLRAYIEIHIATLCWGLAAILGDLIDMHWFMITWWRVLLASIGIFLIWKYLNNSSKPKTGDIIKFSIAGIIVGLHWLCFFASIKLANASVALVTYASTSFIIALIEPLVLGNRWSKVDLSIGILIIPAMALIVSHLSMEMMLGFWVGILSAFLSALFGVFNKKIINRADPMTINLIEIASSSLFLSFVLPFWFTFQDSEKFLPVGLDWLYLSILVCACTILAFYLYLRTLRQLTPFAQSVVMNLEPIYGIVLAILILGDNRDLNVNFYIGAGIIVLTVFLHPFLKTKYQLKSEVPH